MIGKSVSHYQIVEKLGGGGMGVVYRAEDTRLGRSVAIKFLPPAFFEDTLAVKRFQREARASAALNHPHICMVLDVGEHEGQPYLVMEHLQGETLKHTLDKGALPLKKALTLAAQITGALQAAHTQGIIHRDIKPANIFFTSDGYAKVLDFGLAKRMVTEGKAEEDLSSALTRAGATLGTLAYMSPQQLRGQELDTRTDIYSFGVVLYEMVTGVHPFRRETVTDTSSAIIKEPPPPLSRYLNDVPEALEHILRKMLAKNPERRQQSMQGVQNDLAQLVEDSGIQPIPADRRVNRWLLMAAIPLLLVVAILAGIYGPDLISSGSNSAQQTSSVEQRRSVAVLPLENLSGDPENEYFSDGITETIITQLSKIEQLRVVSRTSVMRLKNTEKNLAEIAEELDVATILEGSVQRTSSHVRISAQLIDAGSDRNLWAETYDRELKEIFAIQSEVAEQIAAALQAELSAREVERIEKKDTENFEAYNLYLQGRYFRYLETTASLQKAVEYFQQAIALDPNYALAHAGLSTTYLALDGFTAGERSDEAERAAKRALDLDEGAPEAHIARGIIRRMLYRDHDGAEAAFRQALRLNPSNVDAHREYGILLLRSLGRSSEALVELTRAHELDPLFPQTTFVLSEAHRAVGAIDEAIRTSAKLLELDPSDRFGLNGMVAGYLYLADYQRVDYWSNKSLEIHPAAPISAVTSVPRRSLRSLILRGKLSEAAEITE